MKVSKVENINFDKLMEVMASNKISDAQKAQFFSQHKPQIEKIIETKITDSEFKDMMGKRAIIKFRPLKNSFTKKGDKILLSKALEVNTSDVNGYIKKVSTAIENTENLDFLPNDKIEMIKTYVYRHGSKDELVNFLDYELTKSKDIIKSLYSTLEYYSGGVADYFIRPIHRMDNKTLIKVFNVINKNIKQKTLEGNISEAESEKLAKWALIKIYKIQNNSKLINAIKTYNVLK
jgi:hypothetical protein